MSTMSTRIIATIGPKSEESRKLIALLKAGVDIVRVNFSHATEEQYRRIYKIIQEYNEVNNTKVAVFLDLQGPRIRVGMLPPEGLLLKRGECYDFTYSTKTYQIGGPIPIDNKELVRDIKKGHPFFLCDGEINLEVTAVKNKLISTKVVDSGLLSSHKGVNVPETIIRQGGLTSKDVKDLKFGLKVGLDYVGLSFVQSDADVKKVRSILGKDSKVKIISKIERKIALKNIDQIILASDAIMIARGDLGIETPIEELPLVQKSLIRHAHWHHKPAIIATQVLSSMLHSTQPTRAEISDIANAVLDGAGMIMLSDETAVGLYPLEAVKILKKVAKRMDEHLRLRYNNI